MKPILALDQGTTSSRTLLFGSDFQVLASAQKEITQHYPKPGWVEHDAEEIWESQSQTLKQVARQGGLGAKDFGAIGITNQRETVVAWDKKTGRALAKAIVWQDRRTAETCQAFRRRGLEAMLRRKTGLLFDPYFSATKMAWLLKHDPAVKAAAKAKTLAFGTIDSWLLFRLTGGLRHATDASNASRTALLNLRTLAWDDELLELFGIPHETLPEVLASDHVFGVTDLPFLKGVPICGMIGDQQSALFGHRCFAPGEAKNTYGTGCFLLRQIGDKPLAPPKGLLTTVAWQVQDQVAYAHEGAVMIGGAAIQYLRDSLGLIAHADESESLAESLKSNDGVYFVPAFAGLGTPYWDADARGLLIGLTRGTGRAHIARAALEAIAYQSADLVHAFGKRGIRLLRTDGGASRNRFLMQFQADILGVTVEASSQPEMTALGAAMLAAVGAGLLSLKRLRGMSWPQIRYKPHWTAAQRKQALAGWRAAVKRGRGWAREIPA